MAGGTASLGLLGCRVQLGSGLPGSGGLGTGAGRRGEMGLGMGFDGDFMVI